MGTGLDLIRYNWFRAERERGSITFRVRCLAEFLQLRLMRSQREHSQPANPPSVKQGVGKQLC